MTDEYTIVERASESKQAFLELYHTYYPKLYAYLLVRTHSKELAEDITQETFVKALKAIKAYRFRGSSFGAWFFTIARNELVSHYRKHGRVLVLEQELLQSHMPQSLSPQDEQMLQEHADGKEHIHKEILEAMDSLSNEERELVSMKYIAGLSYEEIQKIYKKRQNTLAVTLHRAVQKLRNKLSNVEGLS